MNNNKIILAVIVSYNPDKSIIRLYNSIKEQVDELIIVDNFTTNEESKKYLQDLSKEVKVIYNDKNYGIAKTLNKSAKYAIDNGYQWLLTLDQDSEFLPNTYKLMLQSYEIMNDKDKTMLIAPQYIEKINYSKEKDYSIPTIDKIQWEAKTSVITSGSLIKIDCFKYIGFFEEKLFIDKVDIEFTLRIKAKGFISKIAKNIFFFHELCKPKYKFGIKTTNMPTFRRYYSSRSAVIMFKKYFKIYPFKMLYILIRSSILIAPLYIFLLEDDKFNKIKNIYIGLIDGILNKYE